jgi:hypothetical protein
VTVKIASQVVSVPVEALPLAESGRAEGFFVDADGYGIVVDSGASESTQRAAIERATVEAARFLSRKFLN